MVCVTQPANESRLNNKWYAMTDSRLIEITNRIIEKSRDSRAAYLAKVQKSRRTGPSRHHLGCANLAHGFAACDTSDKQALAEGQVQLGTSFGQLRSPDIARILAAAGFRWAFLDTEHGGFDLETIQDICRAAVPAGLCPIRLKSQRRSLITAPTA